MIGFLEGIEEAEGTLVGLEWKNLEGFKKGEWLETLDNEDENPV